MEISFLYLFLIGEGHVIIANNGKVASSVSSYSASNERLEQSMTRLSSGQRVLIPNEELDAL
ncbi:MAG: hypothetical protein K0S07_1155 [Chlamydiales bacterium]|jgi:hypothetical protein|nr:hypothetical protein [Chlamydiales bacterium]